ncbi:MAG: hypothetical protein DRO18_08070 [Thermoprotei archaeon]|nr:MAG: hypothetical protein DRO18_08070 [Thermoprotei archaeon]
MVLTESLETDVPIEFRPSPKLVRIYWMYSLWYFIPAVISYSLVALANVLLSIILLIVLAALPAAFLAYWIPKYYRSITFKLERDHAYAKFGVWWVREKRVHYNLVSEVRLRHGPLQRSWGLACIDVYTPATGSKKPELAFFQLSNDEAEKIASELRFRVGILSSKERRVIEEKILNELKAIRKLLESIVSKGKG